MKVGDIVIVNQQDCASETPLVGKLGVVISVGERHNVYEEKIVHVLIDGSVKTLGKYSLNVSDELSDEQLDCVRGGMAQNTFGIWRTDILNENG